MLCSDGDTFSFGICNLPFSLFLSREVTKEFAEKVCRRSMYEQVTSNNTIVRNMLDNSEHMLANKGQYNPL